MAKISIFELTEHTAVLEAIRRYDALGREAFLRVHGYGPAKSYFLLHEGREYDSKAIAGVAYGIQHGVKVTPDQFSGGQETVAWAFERLGFEVVRAGPWDPNARTLVTRPAGAREGHAREPGVEERLDDPDGTGADEERSEGRQRGETALAAETPVGYRTQTKRPRGEAPAVEPGALLSLHRGPRRVAPRTAAEPRVEDPELHDRANEAHESVRGELVRFLQAHGFSPYDASAVAKQHNLDFDLAADGGELRLVIEAKSMPADPSAEAARLRTGLGQVIWYRHRFRAVSGQRRVAVLLVERQPRDHEDWLAACRDADVVLTWPERFAWLVDECRSAQVHE